MMEGWEEIKLGDVVDIGSSKRIYASDYVENGIPFYRSKEVIETYRGIDISLELFISEEKYNLIKEKYGVPQIGDILITSVGTIGIPLVIKLNESFYFKDGNLIWVKTSKVKDQLDPAYFYFFLDSAYGQAKLDSVLIGSSQKALTISGLNRLKINLPPLPTQRKIASILSAYDDLIENNLKRIKLLEEKAQLTYEEWFVRMKFPGHETTPINKETGLPEGWEKVKIGDVCAVSGGGTPSKVISEYWDKGTITWFSPTDLSKSGSLIQLDSESHITELGLQKSSAKLLQPNSFMMTSRATIGLFGIIEEPFSTNQGFINVTPNEDFEKEYLIYNFKYNIQLFINYATGATFLEISKSVFKKIKINWPTINVITKFNEVVAPIHKAMLALTKQNQLLKEARDILLPRLMTGMIDVEELNLNGFEQTQDVRINQAGNLGLIN
jgi:type I restriction enzyme S subunit